MKPSGRSDGLLSAGTWISDALLGDDGSRQPCPTTRRPKVNNIKGVGAKGTSNTRNTRDSLVITNPATTNLLLAGLLVSGRVSRRGPELSCGCVHTWRLWWTVYDFSLPMRGWRRSRGGSKARHLSRSTWILRVSLYRVNTGCRDRRTSTSSERKRSWWFHVVFHVINLRLKLNFCPVQIYSGPSTWATVKRGLKHGQHNLRLSSRTGGTC